MREAMNNVHIEGILNEVNLKDITYKSKKTGQDVKAIGGSIDIKVRQNINGEDKTLIIPVQIFANEFNAKGNPSPLYTNFQNIKNGLYKSAAVTGDEETADRIKVDRGQIRLHSYVSNAGKLVSFPQISANFIQQISKAQCKEQATFQVEFVVRQAMMETNADGEETGRYKMLGIIPGWGGRVDVVPFFAVNPGVIDAVSAYWNPNDTVRANGKLNFSAEVQKVLTPVDFGEPIESTRTIRVSDLIITGGSQAPLSGENEFPINEINEGVAAWKKSQDDLLAAGPRQKKSAPATSAKAEESADDTFGDYGF